MNAYFNTSSPYKKLAQNSQPICTLLKDACHIYLTLFIIH